MNLQITYNITTCHDSFRIIIRYKLYLEATVLLYAIQFVW